MVKSVFSHNTKKVSFFTPILNDDAETAPEKLEQYLMPSKSPKSGKKFSNKFIENVELMSRRKYLNFVSNAFLKESIRKIRRRSNVRNNVNKRRGRINQNTTVIQNEQQLHDKNMLNENLNERLQFNKDPTKLTNTISRLYQFYEELKISSSRESNH
jgi:hypothetical protein